MEKSCLIPMQNEVHNEKMVATDWNYRDNADKWRKSWEDMANAELERLGFDSHIDRRTYEEQGIELISTVRLGAIVSINRNTKVCILHMKPPQNNPQASSRNARKKSARRQRVSRTASIGTCHVRNRRRVSSWCFTNLFRPENATTDFQVGR